MSEKTPETKQKILVIAEKPSVARDYARVLKCSGRGDGCLIGDDYIVSWAVGHLIELCEPDKYDDRYKRWNYADLPIIPPEMKLQVIRGNGKQFQILKKLMNSKETSRIICGTDSGREGELIFRYIYQVAGCKKPFDRLWVSSMTDEAIRKGFHDLKDGREYDSLFDSAKCRSEADWLVGINGSRAFTVKYDALLSIGRVQTPTLSIIVNRQKEIDSFVPENYYEVKLNHPSGLHSPEDSAFLSGWFTWKDKETDHKETDGSETDQATLETDKVSTSSKEKQKETRLEKEEDAKRIAEGAEKIGKATVESVTKTPGKQLPPLLYDLTELQRDANRRYGFSANKTLNIAQSLYEKYKLLTYPRTDSRHLPDDMKETVRKTLHAINVPEFHDALMGIKELRFSKRIIDNSKITDHHAIIPTPKTPDLSKLPSDEAAIYKMVCQRLMEVFYPAYEYESTEAILRVEDASMGYNELFSARGRVITELGFMALRKKDTQDAVTKTGKTKRSKKSSKDEEEETNLPELKVGEIVPIEKAAIQSKKTQPPKPFTEATLLTAMEYAGKYIEDEDLKEEMDKLSLGTPATRASIIERLIAVKYIHRQGKALLPTEKGKQLIAIVPQELKSPEMTGKWERSLEKIYQGSMDPERFMGSIERYVRYIVGSAGTVNETVKFQREEKKKRNARSQGSEGSGRASELGICPVCHNGNVLRNSKAYYCTNWKQGCKFTVWIDSLDRYGAHLDDGLMKQLLTPGDTKPAVEMPLTLPQTMEKGTGKVYLTEAGKVEIKDFKRS